MKKLLILLLLSSKAFSQTIESVGVIPFQSINMTSFTADMTATNKVVVVNSTGQFGVKSEGINRYFSISANTTLTSTDRYVLIPLLSTFTVTLPSAVGKTGQVYTIANKSGLTKTIGTYLNLSSTGSSTLTTGTGIVVISDGVNWQQMQ
jgi:hypothetical protein